MEQRGIPFELRDIKADPAYAEEVKEHTGKLGVPYLVIDGAWVCGYRIGEPFSEEFAASLFE
jgi:glutaredoxin